MTFASRIKAAKPGAVVDLGQEVVPAATYKSPKMPLTIKGGLWQTGVRLLGWSDLTLDGPVVAKSPIARMNPHLWIDACEGVTIRGLTSTGDAQRLGKLLNISRSKRVDVSGAQFAGIYRGVFVSTSEAVRIADSLFWGLGSDGVDIGESHGVTIEGCAMWGWELLGAAHPDAVQIINAPGGGLCSDIIVRRNSIVGKTQGINLFDHDRGGADRVEVSDNTLCIPYLHGINLENVRGVRVTGNRLSKMPTLDRYTPRIALTGCSEVVNEGNFVV